MAIDDAAASAAGQAGSNRPSHPPQEDRAPLAFGPFVLDATEGRLTREGAAIGLPPRPLAVLAHLTRHAGRLVTKGALLDAVWGHRHVTESVLKVCVNTLRAAIGDDARSPRWIETVARRGYRFIGQVAAVPAAACVPPQRATAHGSLPAPGGPLIGREADVATLLELTTAQRLVTLTGSGGIGKTSLAVAVATLAAERFAQGAWLVRLDALADGEALVATVARTLRLAAAAGADAAALARALSPQSLLLVLDNCEHLLDAVAPLLRTLLAGAPRVHVLVTSQEPVRLEVEHVWRVEPLRCPAASDLAQAERFSAVALLLQRVRQRLPGFELDAAGRVTASALCTSLDGLPLALELAAARVPLLGLDGVLARLHDSLQLLTQGARDAAPRQRTLRATLQWSHALLDTAEQDLLCRLGVFAGGFSLAAADALAADLGSPSRPVLDMLGSLLDKSLLVSLNAPPAGARQAAPRLRMFGHIRAFALEGLAARGALQATRERHARWMGDVLRAAAATVHDTPTLEWTDALLPEVDNLRLALGHSLLHAPMQALALCADAMWLWQRAGLRHEAQRWWNAVQPLLAGEAVPETLRAAMAQTRGVLFVYGLHGQPAEAMVALQEAVQRHRAAGDAVNEYVDLYLLEQTRLRIEPDIDRPDIRQRMAALEEPKWSVLRGRYRRAIEGARLRDGGDVEGYRRFCIDEIERLRGAGDHNGVWVWRRRVEAQWSRR